MSFENERSQRGFTLIELLVAVLVLGILAGIVVFAVGTTTSNASKQACVVEGREFANSVTAAGAARPPVVLDGSLPKTDAAKLHSAGLVRTWSFKFLADAAGGQTSEPGSYPTGWTYAGGSVNTDTCA